MAPLKVDQKCSGDQLVVFRRSTRFEVYTLLVSVMGSIPFRFLERENGYWNVTDIR